MGSNRIHAAPPPPPPPQMYQGAPSERPTGVLLPDEAGGQQRVVRELPSPKSLQSSSSFIDSFKGLENLTLDERSRILQAKSVDEAKSSVGILQRFLDFFRGLVKWPTSTEAATNLFNAVHGKGSVEAFHAIRAAVRPEERHHFKMDVVEHKTGERQFRMLAGELELFDSGKMRADSAEWQKVKDARLIAATSDMLGRLTPPVDAEQQLCRIRETGDFRTFQALRDQLPAADRALAEVVENTWDGHWYYQLKIGGTDVFSSGPLLDGTLTAAEKAELTGPQPLIESRTRALHQKLQIAVLAEAVSSILVNGLSWQDGYPELEEFWTERTAIERRTVDSLAGKSNFQRHGLVVNLVSDDKSAYYKDDPDGAAAAGKQIAALADAFFPQTIENNCDVDSLYWIIEEDRQKYLFDRKPGTEASYKAIGKNLSRASYSLAGREMTGFVGNVEKDWERFEREFFNVLEGTREQLDTIALLACQRLSGIITESALTVNDGKLTLGDQAYVGGVGKSSYNISQEGENIRLLQRYNGSWQPEEHLRSLDLGPRPDTVKAPVLSADLTIFPDGSVHIDSVDCYAGNTPPESSPQAADPPSAGRE